MHRTWVIVVALAACGQSSKHASTMPVGGNEPSAPCAEVADHVVSLLKDVAADKRTPYRNVIAGRCTQDRWSAEVQQCLSATQTAPEGDRCERMLPADQAQGLEHDLQAIGDAAPGGAPAAAPMSAPPAAEPVMPAPKSGKPHKAGDPDEGGE